MLMARDVCGRCQRPASVCLCSHLVEAVAPLTLVIWQDPDESRHRLSTAPLLNLSFSNSRLVVGDQFEPEVLLGTGWQQNTVLLYPLDNKPAVGRSKAQEAQQLLILDGTWRKVKRLLLLNPWLEDVPHLQLSPTSISRYAIRKSPRRDGLSTIEAGVAACNWISSGDVYDPVLSVLDRMVALQQRCQKQKMG